MLVSSSTKLPRSEWPAQLLEIPQPPDQLYLEGTLPEPGAIYLTVVGSRKYSNYGKEACEKILAEIAPASQSGQGQNIVIVSGLALGIDTIAHHVALANRLKTIAFPGSGLDRSVLHPHSNRRLADEIVAAGGALVSEFDPTYPAGLHTFPRRNRLMAGIAKAVLIIEAGDKSGTLITARMATDYNRDVLAVPGSIFSGGSRGTNNLIRLGATPITSGDDLLLALGFEVATKEGQLALNLADLTAPERRLVEILEIEPLPRDELIRLLGLPTSEANSLLGIMEIKGLIKETMGEIRLT